MRAMPSIGDLANDIAAALYAARIAVAIMSVAFVVGLLIVARRSGWFAAARRHPGRTAIVVVMILVVAMPTAWYLGSPLFIRTSLVEAAPVPPAVTAVPLATSSPSAPTTAPGTPTATPTPTASPTATPFAPTTIAVGEFSGADDFHFGRGTASIVEVAPGRFHLRLEDFSVRNGPDLYVVLSTAPDGYADDALELGTLKATDGAFGYDLPAGVEPSAFRSAIIWCKQFSQLFAVAPFDA